MDERLMKAYEFFDRIALKLRYRNAWEMFLRFGATLFAVYALTVVLGLGQPENDWQKQLDCKQFSPMIHQARECLQKEQNYTSQWYPVLMCSPVSPYGISTGDFNYSLLVKK